MITNFLKSGLSSFQSMSFSSNQQKSNSPSINLQKIVEDTLLALNQMLGDKLGEYIEGQDMKQLSEELLKSKSLQSNLVETKQRYNDLVNKSTLLYQQARKISASVGEFITSINLFLQNDQLLVPLGDIQKGISELLPEKVQKHINYLIKIFANNFQEIIDKNIRQVEKNMGQEIKLMKNLNKNLESQIIAIKNNKNYDQSKFFELTMKVSSLNEKINLMNSEKALNEKEHQKQLTQLQEKIKVIADQQQEIKKMKYKQNQLLEKIKQYDLKTSKAQRQYKESNNETSALNQIIQKLKQRQEQIVEQFETEIKKKQNFQESLRKKIINEKSILEQKVERITQQNILLQRQVKLKNQEISQLKQELVKLNNSSNLQIDLKDNRDAFDGMKPEQGDHKDILKYKQQKLSVKDLMLKLSKLESQYQDLKETLNNQRTLNVNKHVLRDLFLSYDNEQKQWAVRRNIKYQIYTLLDLKHKMPKPEEPSNNKWFGIF